MNMGDIGFQLHSGIRLVNGGSRVAWYLEIFINNTTMNVKFVGYTQGLTKCSVTIE